MCSAKQIVHVDVDALQSVGGQLGCGGSAIFLSYWGVDLKGRGWVYHISVCIISNGLRGGAEEVWGVNPSHGKDRVNAEKAGGAGRDGG